MPLGSTISSSYYSNDLAGHGPVLNNVPYPHDAPATPASNQIRYVFIPCATSANEILRRHWQNSALGDLDRWCQQDALDDGLQQEALGFCHASPGRPTYSNPISTWPTARSHGGPSFRGTGCDRLDSCNFSPHGRRDNFHSNTSSHRSSRESPSFTDCSSSSESGSWSLSQQHDVLPTNPPAPKRRRVTRESTRRSRQDRGAPELSGNLRFDDGRTHYSNSRQHPHPSAQRAASVASPSSEEQLTTTAEEELPLSAYDFMDYFGVTGTRTGFPGDPCDDPALQRAGWWPVPSFAEDAQILSDAFFDPTIFNASGFGASVGEVESLEFQKQPNPQALAMVPISEETWLYEKPSTTSWHDAWAGHGEFACLTANMLFDDFAIGDLEFDDVALSHKPSSLSATTHTAEERQLPSLRIIYENGRGDLTTEDDQRVTNGRRGPLPPEKARQIAQTRREKTVCISCRMKKLAVSC
jgi:hypothetical protein